MGDNPEVVQQTTYKVHNHTEARNAILVIMGLAVSEKDNGSVYSLGIRELGEKRVFRLVFSPTITLKHTIQLAKDTAGTVVKDMFKGRNEFVLQLIATRIDKGSIGTLKD